MTVIRCTHCGGEIQHPGGPAPRFCPFCGQPLAASTQAAPSPLETALAAEKNPKKKYKMIQDALAKTPNDFFANRALLFHGRLHEPMRGRALDFSIIKCHLLSVFEKPESYTDAQIDEKLSDLLHSDQLKRTMSLSDDAELFYIEYLRRLAYEYVDLFIRGDSRYSRVAFGFHRSPDSLARACADPVRRMLRKIDASPHLDETSRGLLLSAVRDGYARVFPGSVQFLEEA